MNVTEHPTPKPPAPSLNTHVTGECLLSVTDIAEKLSLSESRVWEIVRDAAMAFPEPVKIGGATRWSALEVEAWIEAQKAARSTTKQRRSA